MVYHKGPKENVLKELSVSAASGLTTGEAGERLLKYGENKLREKKKKTTFQRFLEQFKDVMILILLVFTIKERCTLRNVEGSACSRVFMFISVMMLFCSSLV